MFFYKLKNVAIKDPGSPVLGHRRALSSPSSPKNLKQRTQSVDKLTTKTQEVVNFIRGILKLDQSTSLEKTSKNHEEIAKSLFALLSDKNSKTFLLSAVNSIMGTQENVTVLCEALSKNVTSKTSSMPTNITVSTDPDTLAKNASQFVVDILFENLPRPSSTIVLSEQMTVGSDLGESYSSVKVDVNTWFGETLEAIRYVITKVSENTKYPPLEELKSDKRVFVLPEKGNTHVDASVVLTLPQFTDQLVVTPHLAMLQTDLKQDYFTPLLPFFMEKSLLDKLNDFLNFLPDDFKPSSEFQTDFLGLVRTVRNDTDIKMEVDGKAIKTFAASNLEDFKSFLGKNNSYLKELVVLYLKNEKVVGLIWKRFNANQMHTLIGLAMATPQTASEKFYPFLKAATLLLPATFAADDPIENMSRDKAESFAKKMMGVFEGSFSNKSLSKMTYEEACLKLAKDALTAALDEDGQFDDTDLKDRYWKFFRSIYEAQLKANVTETTYRADTNVATDYNLYLQVRCITTGLDPMDACVIMGLKVLDFVENKHFRDLFVSLQRFRQLNVGLLNDIFSLFKELGEVGVSLDFEKSVRDLKADELVKLPFNGVLIKSYNEGLTINEAIKSMMDEVEKYRTSATSTINLIRSTATKKGHTLTESENDYLLYLERWQTIANPFWHFLSSRYGLTDSSITSDNIAAASELTKLALQPKSKAKDPPKSLTLEVKDDKQSFDSQLLLTVYESEAFKKLPVEIQGRLLGSFESIKSKGG